MVICELCGEPSNSLGHVCRVIKEQVEHEAVVDQDLKDLKEAIYHTPNASSCALSRLVVWLTERALKEDSSR